MSFPIIFCDSQWLKKKVLSKILSFFCFKKTYDTAKKNWTTTVIGEFLAGFGLKRPAKYILKTIIGFEQLSGNIIPLKPQRRRLSTSCHPIDPLVREAPMTAMERGLNMLSIETPLSFGSSLPLELEQSVIQGWMKRDYKIVYKKIGKRELIPLPRSPQIGGD